MSALLQQILRVKGIAAAHVKREAGINAAQFNDLDQQLTNPLSRVQIISAGSDATFINHPAQYVEIVDRFISDLDVEPTWQSTPAANG